MNKRVRNRNWSYPKAFKENIREGFEIPQIVELSTIRLGTLGIENFRVVEKLIDVRSLLHQLLEDVFPFFRSEPTGHPILSRPFTIFEK